MRKLYLPLAAMAAAAFMLPGAAHAQAGLTDFLYQRDGEIIAFARPDLAVSGTGSSSVAQVADIQAMNAV
jgi:hypothetical protein